MMEIQIINNHEIGLQFINVCIRFNRRVKTTRTRKLKSVVEDHGICSRKAKNVMIFTAKNMIMASTCYYIIEKQNVTYLIHDLNKFELPIGNSV